MQYLHLAAEREISLWWSPEEIHDWIPAVDPWVYETK